jgi:hypothetical protein
MTTIQKPDRRNLPVLTLSSCSSITHLPREVILQAVDSKELPSTPFIEEVRKVSMHDLEAWLRRRGALVEEGVQ